MNNDLQIGMPQNKLEISQLENFDAWFVSLDQWQPTQVQMTNIFESKQADTY